MKIRYSTVVKNGDIASAIEDTISAGASCGDFDVETEATRHSVTIRVFVSNGEQHRKFLRRAAANLSRNAAVRSADYRDTWMRGPRLKVQVHGGKPLRGAIDALVAKAVAKEAGLPAFDAVPEFEKLVDAMMSAVARA